MLPEPGLLRLLTCGSVDDGKSTLIGRLLLDSKALLADALDTLASASRRRGVQGVELSLVTDGLQAEREQGITIDVAYRHFATASRRFILADAPGHEQYTRNMVTAASTADLAIILLDARKGVLAQTRRHTAIAHLLGIRHLVLAVNKMDLAGWSEAIFTRIRGECRAFAADLGNPPMTFLPLSALKGDGVVERGTHMPWYRGPTLLELLEAVPLDEGEQLPLRFPVQGVCRSRPGAAETFRGYAGRVESGTLRAGGEVVALPGPRRTRVRAIHLGGRRLEEALTGQSVILDLEDDLDLARGDLLAEPARLPAVSRDLRATLCWLGETPARTGARYLLRAGAGETRAWLLELESRLDIPTLRPLPADHLAMNDLAEVRLRLQTPLAADPYVANRATGAFILVDEGTNATVAGGLVRSL